MKYCVIKGTANAIAGSIDDKILVANGETARLYGKPVEFEIITEEEYLQRLENLPKPPQLPTEEERLEAIESAILALMEVLG